MRKSFAFLAILALTAVAPRAFAGGALETIDVTAGTPSPIAGHLLAKVIGIRWDSRCIPVQYRMNSTLDPVPNPLGAPVVTLADATAATQASLDTWNAIPTSFIDMRVSGTVANPGVRGFDMVNEVTFRTAAAFTAIASSPSVSLISDSTFVAGDDIDGDGDSDVAAGISSCGDADGDGDVEFPEGFYKAGTILENDVQFNTKTSNGFKFTVNPADADTVTRATDYIGVAVHEFGHSFGLSHVLNNQKSGSDGTGATMFPFIDTGDPAAELSARTVDSDDILFASYFYPEGTAGSGPAALQAGDVAFGSVAGVVTGDVRHGRLDQPLSGGSVVAADRDTGEVIATAFSGTTRLSFNPLTGGLFFLPTVADSVTDGKYSLPLAKGHYILGVEAVDGLPVPATSVSFTTQIGAFFGQQDFNEETYNRREAVLERRPSALKPVSVNAGQTVAGVDIVTNRTINLNNFGNRNFVGFINSPAGRLYAVRIPASQIAAVTPGQDILIHSANFNTNVVDASVPALFAEVALASCTADADGNITGISEVLATTTGFLAQDNDDSPFFFSNPAQLGKRVRRGIERGEISNLLLALRVPTVTPFPGVSGQAPLIGLDGGVTPNDAPIFGLSYLSDDAGATFTRNNTFNFMFSLVLSEPPALP